ncbi:hypothetical protein Lalb_Chr23g0276661 [Lupinus albus]|uniref:Uncharacterized protein n=1 Tax=Lupinus albus TaxID=3870 RepID=A0A6A4NA29_LUPAL|nr:hypothetical protein Lalb_Chr23g0276661 [Lupinus albus]
MYVHTFSLNVSTLFSSLSFIFLIPNNTKNYYISHIFLSPLPLSHFSLFYYFILFNQTKHKCG